MPGVKRGTSWFDTNVNVQASSGSSSSAIPLLPADVLARDIPGLTIVRTLVDLSIHPAIPADEITGSQSVLIGAGMVTADAFIAGALPDLASPSEEPVRGWLFKNNRWTYQSSGDITYATFLHLDIHAQRRLDLDTEVFFQMTNTAMTGTAYVVEVVGLIRMLFKLP